MFSFVRIRLTMVGFGTGIRLESGVSFLSPFLRL